MLKKLRVILSLLFFGLITFLFLDFAGLIANHRLDWLARIQFIPALMAHSIIILLVIIGVTLLFGRIYCSSVCPMGVFQDIVSYVSKKTGKRKKRYRFGKAKNILRLILVGIVAIGVISHVTVLLGLTDPYSAYGRMVSNILRPVYLSGNNLLEKIFTSFDNYTFYRKEIFIADGAAFAVSLITFAGIGFLAWKHGRLYCNTICPVGTILGLAGKFSLIKIRIDESKCNHCSICETKCKASCIDSKKQTIDYSRCVDCFNCLGSCKMKAMKFTFGRKPAFGQNVENSTSTDTGKRRFLLTGIAGIASVPLLMAQNKLNSGKPYLRKNAISPPGALSREHLQRHCTSCHLCIDKCPTQVLKPAFTEYGLGGMMQPMMYFEKGYCNYSCTLCSEVCPTGALKPLTVAEKHLTQVGQVVFVEDLCVVHTEGTNCGACAEHCPTQAVTMVPYKNELTIPHTNPEICVGCGGCEYICPVRPHRAIHVEANLEHKKAKPFDKGEKQKVEIQDFGF